MKTFKHIHVESSNKDSLKVSQKLYFKDNNTIDNYGVSHRFYTDSPKCVCVCMESNSECYIITERVSKSGTLLDISRHTFIDNKYEKNVCMHVTRATELDKIIFESMVESIIRMGFYKVIDPETMEEKHKPIHASDYEYCCL